MNPLHYYKTQKNLRRSYAESLVDEVRMSPTGSIQDARYLRSSVNIESEGPVDRFFRERAVVEALKWPEMISGSENFSRPVNYGREVKGEFDSFSRRAVLGLAAGAVAVIAKLS